ncbi:MAG TPA: DUF922 domain-containing protein [Rubricoccaceae bacterium]|nr:DUF922 domain-containing protein [Rubricoccaceae bacterium]
MRPLLVLLVLAALARPASAQGGGVPGGVPGGVQRTLEVVYYDVQGRSEQDLLQAMLRQGPSWEGHRYFGLTQSEVRYTYWKQESVTGCVLSNIAVYLKITVTLPRWQPTPGTPYAMERNWRQFERALRNHEDGHRRLAEEEAEMIRRMLTGLRAPSCAGVDALAEQQAAQIQQSYGGLNRAYDERTEHGRSQGALWPLGH